MLSFSTVVASVTDRQTDRLTFGLLGLLSQPKIQLCFNIIKSLGITIWEIFSFAEKPYQKEFRIRNPADVKDVLKKEIVMSAPQNYFGDKEKEKKTYEKVKAIYDQVIK